MKQLILLLFPALLSAQAMIRKSIVIEPKHDLVLGMKFPEGTKKQWLWLCRSARFHTSYSLIFKGMNP